MYKRYHRAKAPAIPPGLFLVVLVIALLALRSPSFIHNPYVLIPGTIAIGFLAIIAGAVFLWQMEQRRQAKLRALQLADIDRMDGLVFERYIGTILQSQGYRVRYTEVTGDYGTDLLAVRDRVTYAIQVKRYSGAVGNHAVMEADAGKTHYQANKAVVVTSNYFTPHARILAASNHVTLIDRDKLADWILAFQNGQNKTLPTLLSRLFALFTLNQRRCYSNNEAVKTN